MNIQTRHRAKSKISINNATQNATKKNKSQLKKYNRPDFHCFCLQEQDMLELVLGTT